MIYYKVLEDGTGYSQYQKFRWPIPKGGKNPIPTDWIEIDASKDLVLCVSGLHAWKTLDTAKQYARGGDIICEMEIEGDIVEDHEKVAGRKARLLKRVWPKQIDWRRKIKQANTIVKRIKLYDEVEKSLRWTRQASTYQMGNTTYAPVVPCFHPVGWSCGLDEVWHDGLEGRLNIEKKFPFIDRDAVLILWLQQEGLPLE